MRARFTQIKSALGATLLFLTACGDDGTAPDAGTGPPALVSIAPLSPAIPIDTTVVLTATVTDSAGRVITNPSVHWSTRDPKIATVDSTGLARGVAFGAVSITATVGDKSGTVVASVVLRWSSISAGGTDTCGVTITGVGYCWGNNAVGQLGINAVDFDPHPKPTRVATTVRLHTIVTSAPVGGHTCALSQVGALYCWGANDHGELGTGDSIPAAAPRAVATTQTFAAVTIGDTHSCTLSSQGKAYCWGDNGAGQLGTGVLHDTLAVHPVAGSFVFKALTAGSDYTCGLTVGFATYCWGGNLNGQLGLGAAGTGAAAPTLAVPSLLLATVGAGRGTFTCGAVANGGAYCWGNNASGQLGRGFASAREPVAAALSDPPPLVAVVAGTTHACGLTADGAAWCWGGAGFLGTGSGSGSNVPMRVLQAGPLVFLSAGTNHTCGLDATGTAYCWGRNDLGQLGTGSVSISATAPVKVADRP